MDQRLSSFSSRKKKWHDLEVYIYITFFGSDTTTSVIFIENSAHRSLKNFDYFTNFNSEHDKLKDSPLTKIIRFRNYLNEIKTQNWTFFKKKSKQNMGSQYIKLFKIRIRIRIPRLSQVHPLGHFSRHLLMDGFWNYWKMMKIDEYSCVPKICEKCGCFGKSCGILNTNSIK